MATVAEEDVEYESDPEEAKRSLAMRRREASDDEEGEEDGRDEKADLRVVIHSDDSDGEGGVADYDEEEELDGGEEDEEVDEEEEGDEGDGVDEEVYEERRGEGVNGSGFERSAVMVRDSDSDVRPTLDDSTEVHSGNRDDEEKKENEPFAVPTAGAFYMHDDRFRDNAGGRHRRMHGGRRLWESKDDKKWGHDKFEEITLQARHYKEGRRPSKGNYRGHGKNRGIDRGGGYVRGNRKGYDNSGNRSQVLKGVVRGRGPRRYDPTNKSTGPASQGQNKLLGKPLEKTSHASSGRTLTLTSNSESDLVPAQKQAFASNLNSASPPFYPSGSSNKEINLTPKREVQTGNSSRSVRPGIMDEGFSVRHNNALFRGKNVIDSISMDKLSIDESITPSVGKPLNNLQMPSPGSFGANAAQSPRPRAPGRGVAIPAQINYQPATSRNQVHKVAPTQLQTIQRSFAAGRTSTSVQASAPQLSYRPGSGFQALPPPKTSVAINSLDSGEMDAAAESGKSKGALVGKGKGGSQGSGRGSFVHGGAVGAAGNMSGSHGDQNFPGTPTFLPVMQFGGHQPGGIGVPAVGMAFPGYVAQPQLGLGNSEMTWLPVLAGAAGALGATYCSPYLAVDGAYHAQQPGQASAMVTSSKENDANKVNNNEWKPPQRPELISDEFGQRQNKPRRYSEMNFGQ